MAFALTLTLVLTLLTPSSAEAGNSLRINYLVNPYIPEFTDMISPSFPVESAEALAAYKEMLAIANATKTRTLMTNECKNDFIYKVRVKVLDARGGTAGLGNLNNLVVSKTKIRTFSLNLPTMSDEETLENYTVSEDPTEWPSYVKGGYVSYGIQGECKFSGSVSLISSNAYQIYIYGDLRGEFSKSELVKKKWTVSYWISR
jgi:hypothetical protein